MTPIEKFGIAILVFVPASMRRRVLHMNVGDPSPPTKNAADQAEDAPLVGRVTLSLKRLRPDDRRCLGQQGAGLLGIRRSAELEGGGELTG
jgi:hypothetical protein